MDRADLFRVYELGAAIKPLSELPENGVSVSDFFRHIISAGGALSALMGNDPQAKVDLSVEDARKLQNAINEVERVYFRGQDGQFAYPDDAVTKTIAPWLLWGVRSAAQSFEAVFRAEMHAASTYWVPKRGAFSTRDLVDEFDKAFLPDLHQVIGETALAEYRSAGRCFAFGLWTAAGYHSCRAVEAVLRLYFRAFSSGDDAKFKQWGEVIGELKKLSGPNKPSEKTIFYLEQIKDNERNPLMHVRVVLEEKDADMLLHSSKVLIMLMAGEIEALNGPPLPLAEISYAERLLEAAEPTQAI